MLYLDCNATTPLEPAVVEVLMHYLTAEYGNAGSRTHHFGRNAANAVNKARLQIARITGCDADDVVFTSGATEANNLALLGLEAYGLNHGRRHIVTTAIEHKAVLEPVERLRSRGFDVEHVPPDAHGVVSAEDVLARVRTDTLAVSVMHANNETGVLQPIETIAEGLGGYEAFFHVDAAQSFGKVIAALRHPRIDLVSASAHKVYGPKGVGALMVRKRGYQRVPLQPLMVGGGQERGLRPGTLPVALIAAFGLACEIALRDHAKRETLNRKVQTDLFAALADVQHSINGRPDQMLAHVANVCITGADSEALMLMMKSDIACANGAACTSHAYTKSHVLCAMGLDDQAIGSSIRLSWSHLTGPVDWSPLTNAIAQTTRIRAA